MARVARHLSPLHSKGILTLSLLLLAESVSFVNAVSLWSSPKTSSDGGSKGKFFDGAGAHDTSGCNPLSGSCPSVDSNLPLSRLFSRKPLGQRVSSIKRLAEDCCAECSNCMDAKTAARQCANMPRGGHAGHGHGVVDHLTHAGVTPYGIPLNAWKVIFQAILTAINVICWLVPLRSKKMSENKLALSLANAFSGGVFLSLAFGHLIPECIHGFEASTYAETTPFMLVLAGYLLIFFVEKVAFDAHDILHEMQGDDHHHHKHPDGHKHKDKKSSGGTEAASSLSSGRSAVILLGALAVHSILEMMALGLADTFGDCALLTMSISLHQPAESIALLVAFLKSGVPEAQIIQYLSIFSCMGPIGVALGMAVNEFAAPIVDSMMLAVVAGTFVYVGATEVIPEEWEDSTHKWKKFAALMSGIVSIFVITQYTMSLGGHSH
ncbi:predicted protein [Phaeodactylum tricornutum CCAP 1055/1]|jgi:zinc transporter 1/2/3|uniref:Uncharacterized protein n=1 Tax=Phaeodactylum tricornutum (strain CCAP 1055/1) TaxID=556484 RepID=B5Y3R5_PHATC|nr:predicted protein [Phaeodactylum tricornutum CCAP 1055/1]ACI65172.1 predicted protein [Phaeodactylum tricornutum CCAP 1055/1]|eukprot:XP_002185702.1 predicted protein [Phaeodactylum tricornutum CCAP 1055/1]